jgi:hypothetical protein
MNPYLVCGIEHQAVADGVDILSLSLGPNSPPGASSSTFLNILDLALLNAVKANVLVVQAAGNGGPYEKSMTSFSPWVVSVAAGVDDRSYPNTITLSDQTVLPGIALARKEKICCTFVLYVFFHPHLEYTAVTY